MSPMIALPATTDADELLGANERPDRIVRAGAALIALLSLGLGSWLCLVPLSGAVIAGGVVKVDMNRKTVQHQEGGIVRELHVRDGDRVRAGQPLLVIGDVRVSAMFEIHRGQLDSEMAKAARLEAEQSQAPAIRFPTELHAREAEPGVRALLMRERALFDARRSALTGQIALIAAQARQTQAEIESRRQQLSAAERAFQLQQEELSANRALLQEGFISRARLLGIERALMDYEARRGESLAELAQARQHLAELQLRAAGLRDRYMQEAADEHKRTVAVIADLAERLRTSVDAQERQVVSAPVAGEVVDLRIAGVGAIVGPRDPILDIVPENAELIVEARVRPEDVLSVRAEAQADVRLVAMKQRITPIARGVVVYVSADRLEDKISRLSYYVANVRLSPEALRDAGNLKLQAGMPAEVFIRTSERTALEYLIDPLSGFVRHALREP
jgi:HlyD family type I secretion membrane fusion protein